MMFRAKLAAFAGAMILAGTAFASQEMCPELSTIQAEGIADAMQFYGMFAAYQVSDYDTDANWGFVIAPINSDSEEEAIDEANDILASMTAPGVLMEEGLCQYDTGMPDVFAVAVKNEFPTPMKLRQYIRR